MEKIIEWKDKELIIRDFEKSHANGGRLGKLWAEDLKSGRIFLIKSSSPFSYEPFSEKMAYIIGRDIGVDVLEYDIMPADELRDIMYIHPLCKYVSVCEKIDRKGYVISSVAEIKRARNALVNDDSKKVKNKEVMYEILSKQYIDTMLLFDAIIGNEDRHYGNVHVLRTMNGEIVGAPILDNGASLLALRPIWEILFWNNKVGEKCNKAFTIADNHDKQLETVTEVNNISFNITTKTMQILKDLEPTLNLMPKTRATLIKKFIVYRLHKYLGMMKYSDNIEYFKSKQSRSNRQLKEQEESCKK